MVQSQHKTQTVDARLEVTELDPGTQGIYIGFPGAARDHVILNKNLSEEEQDQVGTELCNSANTYRKNQGELDRVIPFHLVKNE